MTIRLKLKLRTPKYPVVTVPASLTGTTTEGETLTFNAATFDITTRAVERRYSVVTGLGDDWEEVENESGATIDIPSGYVGKRIRPETRGLGTEGFGDWFPGLPTNPIDEAPLAPLQMSGTPITSATSGAAYSFTVVVTGGDGVYDDGAITGAPTGLAVTKNGSNSYVVAGPITQTGTFNSINLTVRDNNGAGNPVSLLWNLTVSSSSGITKLTPGSGWGSTVTADPATRGSSANAGWGHKPFLGWGEAQFETYTGEFIVEILGFAVSTQADYNADQTPVFGMYSLEASVGNGTWQTITPGYDSATGRYSYKVRVDPNDFADGTWLSDNGLREIRVRAVGKNGDGVVMQGSPHTYPYAYVGFKFNTNADSTLSTPIKYASPSGNDTTGTGTSGNPYLTIGKAAIAAGHGGIVKLKAGTTYRLDGVTSALADNGRWLTIQADDGLVPSQVVIASVGSASSWLIKRVKIVGCTIKYTVPLSANYCCYIRDSVFDPGSAYRRVTGVSPWNYGVSTALNYIVNTSVTNCAFGPTRAQLIDRVTVGTILEDTFGYSRVVMNSSVNEILSGQRQSSPGVWDGGGNAHPDVCQYSLGGSAPTNYTYDWFWGALHYNINITTGLADSQGPFFKDVGHFRRFFLINYNFKMSNASQGRQLLYLHRDTSPVELSTMYGSMFFDVNLDGNTKGIKTWAGTSDDVVAVRLRLTNVNGGNNSVPSGMLNYAA